MAEIVINFIGMVFHVNLVWYYDLSLAGGISGTMLACALLWPDHSIIFATSYLGSYQFFTGIGVLCGTFPYKMSGGPAVWWVCFGLLIALFLSALVTQFWLRSRDIEAMLEAQGLLGEIELQNEDHRNLKIGMAAKGYGYDLRDTKYKNKDAKGVL